MDKRLLVALLLAVVVDLADILTFAWLPIIGDTLDVFAIVALLVLLRNPIVLLGAVEFIPFMDFLPLFVVAVALSSKQINKKISEIVS